MKPMFTNPERYAEWFNLKYPGAPRRVTRTDIENIEACELIHRYGFYSTSEDGKTVMGILKYEQLIGRMPIQESRDKTESKKCKMCGQPLPIEPKGKSGRPKQYCRTCSLLANKERQKKLRRRRMFNCQ